MAPELIGPAEDVHAIRKLVDAWDAATRRRDGAALATLVTEDCVFHAPGVPPLRGRAAVETALTAAFQSFTLEPRFEVEEIVVSGDLAFLRAADDAIARPLSGAEPIEVNGWGISILMRVRDGRWLFARGINSRTRKTT